MGVPISNVTRRVVYAASGTGPYAFTFEILAAGDIAVYRDDTLLTITTDYTVTINANGTGSITLTASPTGATQIAIVGNRTISRTTDFVTGGDFFANTLNDELDQQTIFNQQNQEGLNRALQAPQTDPTSINMILPRASLRANKALGFDANGNPAIADTLGTNRGNWGASTLYYVRDIVKDTTNNNIWQCITQHTSSGSQPINTNTDSAKWTLLVDAASASTAATNAAASASAASTSATNAASSASAASTSATNAASSASSASTSASNASTSASNASSSASTASTAATNAGNSETAAASSASTASTAATNASNSASAASTSASNASTSATNASNSASTASTAATNASNSASAASTSETNASNSATAAANSATAAAASFDSFDDRYLGAKSSNPTVDNDGNALITGALHFNTTANEMRVYNGSSWVAATVSPDTISEVEFTATAGQTTYAFSGGYRLGYTYVWVNGVLLSDSDITATDGTNITFGTALALNDEVRVMTFKAIGSVTVGDISGLQTALDAKVAGPASSVDGEIALYDSTTGKLIKRASTTGLVKATSGVIGAAVAGTDYLAPAAIGTTVQAYDADLTTLGAGGSGARSFLGLAIGTDVQAYDADTAKTDVAQSWTAAQTFGSGYLKLSGSSSGTATLNAPAAAGTNTYALPPDAATLGYRNAPAVGTKTGSYTLATGDVGKYVQVGSGGSITIPDATFAEGDVVSIFNNTASGVTITCSITTAYIAGTDSDKASVTLATRGVASVLFISSTVCVITGNVS